MQTQAFGPLTMTVQLPVRSITVSVFCPVCAIRRSPPPELGPGLAAWLNPCGHWDSIDGLILEESAQCAAPGCVLLVSVGAWPYCSVECACGVGQPVP
jgi:hypothetical protein